MHIQYICLLISAISVYMISMFRLIEVIAFVCIVNGGMSSVVCRLESELKQRAYVRIIETPPQ